MKCVTLCLFKQEKAFNHVHSDGNKSIQKKLYIYGSVGVGFTFKSNSNPRCMA